MVAVVVATHIEPSIVCEKIGVMQRISVHFLRTWFNAPKQIAAAEIEGKDVGEEVVIAGAISEFIKHNVNTSVMIEDLANIARKSITLSVKLNFTKIAFVPIFIKVHFNGRSLVYHAFNIRSFGNKISNCDYPAEIRKVIYTTNAIESVNMSLRKVTKSRSSFPNDDALIKLYYLALRNISKKWTMPIQNSIFQK